MDGGESIGRCQVPIPSQGGRDHEIEAVGERLRAMHAWDQKGKLVDKREELTLWS